TARSTAPAGRGDGRLPPLYVAPERGSPHLPRSMRPYRSEGAALVLLRSRTVAGAARHVVADCVARPYLQGRHPAGPSQPRAAMPDLYVGVDVSLDALDVATSRGDLLRLPHDDGGLVQLVALCDGAALVVLEATGGIERAPAAELAAAGLPVAVVNPRQVRDFARATGQLAKTDARDAAVLARFAEAVGAEARPLPDAEQRALAALVARRRQLTEMLTAERSRLRTAEPAVRGSVEAVIAFLEGQKADADRALAEAVEASAAWRERDDLLRSVPGVGRVLSATLLADLPEL